MKHVEEQASAYPWLYADGTTAGAGAGAGTASSASAGAGAPASKPVGGKAAAAKPTGMDAAIAAENRRLAEDLKRRLKKPAFIDMQVCACSCMLVRG